MVGRRGAGGRKLAAAPSRQSHRADAIRLGPRLHAAAAASTAFILPRFGWRVLFLTGLFARAAHHLDPAQSEGAAVVDRKTGAPARGSISSGRRSPGGRC